MGGPPAGMASGSPVAHRAAPPPYGVIWTYPEPAGNSVPSRIARYRPTSSRTTRLPCPAELNVPGLANRPLLVPGAGYCTVAYGELPVGGAAKNTVKYQSAGA